MNRVYYKLELTLLSPLSIGSGANENTDRDVLVDSSECPFIPATSLAGVLKSFLTKTEGKAKANEIFGFIPTSETEKKEAQKGNPDYAERPDKIRVYDGTLADEAGKSFFITNRDMVALKNKVGIKGRKFDTEAVEPGVKFVAYLELFEPKYEAQIRKALSALNSGEIRLGSKTSRGYGKVSVNAKAKTICAVDKWLKFDMMEADCWNDADSVNLDKSGQYKITLGLKSTGGISIREYTTEPSTEEQTMPDYETMSIHSCKGNDGTPIPVIPGTSWAGAFKDRFSEFVQDKELTESLFGFVHNPKEDGDDKVRKSSVVFDESQLTGGTWKQTTRNSIDRFSSATKDGALYTERTYYYGKTELVISFASEPSEREKRIFAACLADLHNGFLAVGGLTAVGRGLFEIQSINGTDISAAEAKLENIYGELLKGVGIHE